MGIVTTFTTICDHGERTNDCVECGTARSTRTDLSPILDQISSFLRRYVAWPSPHEVVATTLWAAHTWVMPAAEATPYLAVTSPEKRSGKTRTLDCLEMLVARPWRAVLPSEAVLFRKIEADEPTLLLDEVDPIFGPRGNGEYEPLRAILNSGNRRGTTVPRCVVSGKKIELEEFNVFGPKALAGIGKLPDTVADRSIPIRLQRRAVTEHVERLRDRDARAAARPIREQLGKWAGGAIDDLMGARPELPGAIPDRAADGWEPLLAIADMAGEDWPTDARAAAVALHGGDLTDDESLGVRLLSDLRTVFVDAESDRLSTEAIIGALVDMEEAPWGDLRGRPITPRVLARMLRDYKARSSKIRVGDHTLQGYLVEAFEDVWNRYLPHVPDPKWNNGTLQVDGTFQAEQQ